MYKSTYAIDYHDDLMERFEATEMLPGAHKLVSELDEMICMANNGEDVAEEIAATEMELGSLYEKEAKLKKRVMKIIEAFEKVGGIEQGRKKYNKAAKRFEKLLPISEEELIAITRRFRDEYKWKTHFFEDDAYFPTYDQLLKT